jgi:CDP-glycerol glycerophosphotransferase (TagB/SpsB family)
MKKLFIYFLNLPLYYLSLVIPKNKNIWIFGAWFGEQYADNSRAIYEYVVKHDNTINSIWLTTNNSVYTLLREKGYKVYFTYSIQGYYYSMVAKYIFVSTGMADVNKYVTTTKYKIQLWHGIPLKKIQDDVKRSQKKYFYSNLKKYIFPFTISKYKYLISTSQEVSKNFKTAFSNVEYILETGYPRNDILAKYIQSDIILYLPTHRGEGKGNLDMMFKNFNPEQINSLLKNINKTLIIKLHFYDLKRLKFNDLSNIKFIKEKLDVYELLQNCDILITDYSSIYFDFLLTSRPIIFTPFDLEDYISKDRELYYKYDEVTPGPKCQNWDEVLKWILKFNESSNLFSKEREDAKHKFHKDTNFESSKKLYNLIKGLDT